MTESYKSPLNYSTEQVTAHFKWNEYSFTNLYEKVLVHIIFFA